MADPIQQLLTDLGKLRGQVNTQLLQLPAPDPMKDALRQADSILSKTESDIRGAAHRIGIPEIPWKLTPGS